MQSDPSPRCIAVLAQACQHLWPVANDDDSNESSPYIHHTDPPWPRASRCCQPPSYLAVRWLLRRERDTLSEALATVSYPSAVPRRVRATGRPVMSEALLHDNPFCDLVSHRLFRRSLHRSPPDVPRGHCGPPYAFSAAAFRTPTGSTCGPPWRLVCTDREGRVYQPDAITNRALHAASTRAEAREACALKMAPRWHRPGGAGLSTRRDNKSRTPRRFDEGGSADRMGQLFLCCPRPQCTLTGRRASQRRLRGVWRFLRRTRPRPPRGVPPRGHPGPPYPFSAAPLVRQRERPAVRDGASCAR